MRKIKIYSTVGASGTIETDVRTLGELKPILRQREINYDGMKLLVGETRNELSVDEAVLPEIDFKLYLMPEKTKSGNVVSKLERLAEIFGEAQEICEDLASEIEDNGGNVSSSVVASTGKALSFEDMEAMEDLKRLQGGY